MNIAIITAGSGSERDVSIRSAENLAIHLDHNYEIFLYPEDWDLFVSKKENFDSVIPLVHGDDGEDGLISKRLESLDLPYLFSSPESHALAFDKNKAKESLSKSVLKTAKTYHHDNLNESSFPLVAKPACGGSSIGIFFVHSLEEFRRLDIPKEYLLEEYISGREFTVAVINYRGDNFALEVMEAILPNAIFSYEEKYSQSAADIEVFPTNVSDSLLDSLKSQALLAHEHFGLHHLSRSDFIVNQEGDIYFLETNTIPGMSKDSWFPKMLEKNKILFSDLLNDWLKK